MSPEEFEKAVDSLVDDDSITSWFFNNSGINGVVDNRGYFKKVSKYFSDSLGYSKDEMVSIPFLDFVHPEDRDKTLNLYENLNQYNDGYFCNRYISKSGEIIKIKWALVFKKIGANNLFTGQLHE